MNYGETESPSWTIMNQHQPRKTEKFWMPVYENKKEYNKDATCLQEHKIFVNNITEATYSEIATNESKSAACKFSNWKSLVD